MAERQPTFQPSEKQKPRIKPAGWLLIGVVALLLVTLGGLAVNGLTASSIEPLEGEAVGTVRATATPTPEPKPTPVVWWETELRQETDPLTGKTYLMAPESVAQEVIEQMKADTAAFEALDPSAMSLREYEATLRERYTGEMLEGALAEAEDGFGLYSYRHRSEGVTLRYEVKDFAAGGLECTLGVYQSGGVIHYENWKTGETEDVTFNGLSLVRMRYDLKDGRWKVARVLQVIPAEG